MLLTQYLFATFFRKYAFLKSVRPRRFSAVYRISLSCLKKGDREVTLLFPLPRSGIFQKILVEPRFIGASVDVQREQRYGNPYAISFIRFSGSETKVVEMHFQAEVFPSKLPTKKFFLSEYSKNGQSPYYQANTFIHSHNARIQEIAQRFMREQNEVLPLLRSAYEYVLSHLRYGHPISGLYSTQDALERECVDCGGFNTLFIALCRAMGIPSRLAVGFFAGYTENTMHAWSEVQMPDGSWVAFDPSIEYLRRRRATVKPGGFGSVGSDRLLFSYDCDFVVDIFGRKERLDILQNAVLFPQDSASDVEVKTKLITERL